MNFLNESTQGERTSSMTRNFAINELEKFSGIKAHTLRIWEQRYGVPKPARKNNNSRFYSVEQLVQILDIALLNRHGYKISQLCTFSPQLIKEKIKKLSDEQCRQEAAIADLLYNMYLINIEGFERVLNNSFFTWPVYTVVTKIIYPFLKKTNLLWQGMRLTEEHLVVTTLRKKLMYAIETTPMGTTTRKTVLLFLGDVKQLDLALLYACFLLKYSGIQVVYMGNDVSVENIITVSQKMEVDFLYTYLPDNSNRKINYLATKISEMNPDLRLVLTLHPSNIVNESHPGKVTTMQFEDAVSFLCA